LPLSPGEHLLKALKELGVDDEIINRNMTSASTASWHVLQHSTSSNNNIHTVESVYSVEKSLAKLNLNLTEFVKDTKNKLEEDRDITKEAESAEVSENEQQQQHIQSQQQETVEKEPNAFSTSEIVRIVEEIQQQTVTTTTTTTNEYEPYQDQQGKI
jgi:hypothetical protein